MRGLNLYYLRSVFYATLLIFANPSRVLARAEWQGGGVGHVAYTPMESV